jgi:hypothetical protein
VAQKPKTPDLPEAASSPTQDTASSLELTSAPAVLEDDADEQLCGCGYLCVFPCPKVLSSSPSLSKIHLLVIKYVSAIPGKIAASFGTSTTSIELKSRGLLTTDSGGLDKRQDCTPNLGYGTWKCCFPDLLRGELVCNAGSSFSPPRILAFPALLFKALSSIPQAIALAVPHPLPILEAPSQQKEKRQDDMVGDVEARQTVSNCWINEMGMRQCFTFTPNAGSLSLHIPRLFALPTFLFKAASSLPKAIAAAVPSNRRGNLEANEAPTRVGKEERDSQYTIPPTVCFWGESGKQCVSTSGISSLSIPRIFSLPTLLINLIKQVSSVSALPQHLSQSLAAPNFDLVRENVRTAGETLSSWAKIDERQLPICRPGQPPNLPCKNGASRSGLSYLLSIPLLAFGVMVWL